MGYILTQETGKGVLMFQRANAKLKKLEERTGKRVYSFGTLSGHTCKGARDCLSWVDYDPQQDKYSIADGPHTQFRCYSASAEAFYTPVYNHRLSNMEIVRKHKSSNELATTLQKHLPQNAQIVRVHDAGDIDSDIEFKAWITLAKRKPDVVFYAYTKMLPLWVKYRRSIPPNFILTASYGGKWDNLIAEHNLRHVRVIFKEEDANGLEIDNDDFHAYNPEQSYVSFCLMIHGVQPPGSEASKAWQKIKRLRRESVS